MFFDPQKAAQTEKKDPLERGGEGAHFWSGHPPHIAKGPIPIQEVGLSKGPFRVLEEAQRIRASQPPCI